MIRGKKSEQAFFNELHQGLTEDGQLIYAGRLLRRAAKKFPERTALIFKDQKISYKQLYQRACAFSNMLKQRGVKPGDRVIMCFENSPAFYVAYFGIWQVGAVVVPLNTFLKETELAHIIGDAQPTLIATEADRVELFQKTGIALPPIITDNEMPLEGPVGEQLAEQEMVTLPIDDMAALLYTSGTTGLPKGVMLSSKNIMTNLLQIVSRWQMYEHERIFGVLPLFHVFAQNGCIWASVFWGCTVILVPKIDRRFILKALEHKPTIFLGVPALYGLLCLLKTVPLESVKFFFSGGDALPDKIRMAFAILYRRKIACGYGLTETSPVIAVDLDDEVGPTNRVGKPVIGVRYSVRDEKGNEVPCGQIGELWVKGDNVMLGYYQAPEMTENVLKDGWFNTGDLVYIDRKGKIVITGRVKDLIIHKGLNIYPQEIENVILSHPNAIRVGVIGVREDAAGEVPIAFVQLRKEEPGIEDALKALCDQHLAPYKVPRSFICSVEELPTTATGKVDKKVLRKQAAGE